MHISEFAVRRPELTLMLFLMAASIGVSSLLHIPLTEDPSFPIPSFGIVAVYPGAAPADLEQLVVDPIEDKLNELDDVKSIKSEIEDGVAQITVEFEASADPDKKQDEVVREVNALRPTLPEDLYSLEVRKWDLANVNIMQIALVSESASDQTLEEESRHLKDRLERVPGVRRVERWAVPEREIQVELDPARMAFTRLPADQVLRAVQSQGLNLPGGAADNGERRFHVKTNGGYHTVDEVRNTVVGGDGRSLIRLGSVADVNWGHDDPHYLARWNGRRAVFLTANMKPGRRIGEVRDGIWKALDRYEPEMPAGLALVRPFDQSRNVSRRLDRLLEDFLIALLLVLITLLPLGGRASFVVMIALPLSLAIGVALLQFTGFSINQLSIVGFVIALGLLVDDSIVVVENISRFLRQGASRERAAIGASRQITVAVLGCTATLVAAFIPVFLLPGTPGHYIRSLPASVVFTILGSLLVSLTLVPFLASRLLSSKETPEGNRALRGLNRAIDFTYGRWLHRTLDAPRRTLILAGAFIAASFLLVPVVGFSLFPKADTPQFLVRITAPQGASLSATDRAARFAEDVLLARPEVRDVLTNVGQGNPFVYYNLAPANEQANVAELFVLLRRWDNRRTPALIDTLQKRFDAYPGAHLEVKVFENGPPIDAPIALRVLGENLDSLRVLAARVTRTVESTPDTWHVTNPLQLKSTEAKVAVNVEKAGLLGVPAAEVDRTVRLAFAGQEAGAVREPDGQEYPIRLRLRGAGAYAGAPSGRDAAPPLTILHRLYVAATSGAVVPLDQVSELRLDASTPVIQHYDKERSVTITANVQSGWNTDRVTREVLRRLGAQKIPAGYRIMPAGEIESREESFGGLSNAIILTIFIILGILILEFGSFRGMLIVASVIPLGAVGGLLALFFSGYTLSFTSMIGFIALIGIEIKNSILLVDFTNQLREQGVPVREAVERAGRIRFLPILLTTMTAVGGLLPLAVQRSSLYSPLALVLIGGLISSTLLARLVTPVMYLLLAPPLRPHGPSAGEPTVSPVMGRAAGSGSR